MKVTECLNYRLRHPSVYLIPKLLNLGINDGSIQRKQRLTTKYTRFAQFHKQKTLGSLGIELEEPSSNSSKTTP